MEDRNDIHYEDDAREYAYGLSLRAGDLDEDERSRTLRKRRRPADRDQFEGRVYSMVDGCRS